MGDDIFYEPPNSSYGGSCPYVSYKRDCDGDYQAYCCGNTSCPYCVFKRDCDGDSVAMCNKY